MELHSKSRILALPTNVRQEHSLLCPSVYKGISYLFSLVQISVGLSVFGFVANKYKLRGQASQVKMTSPGGKLTSLACHPTKKVNSRRTYPYLLQNIGRPKHKLWQKVFQ